MTWHVKLVEVEGNCTTQDFENVCCENGSYLPWEADGMERSSEAVAESGSLWLVDGGLQQDVGREMIHLYQMGNETVEEVLVVQLGLAEMAES